MILKILHSFPYYAETETIEVAKGKHKLPETFKEGYEQSKRKILWQLRKQ
jgi:hypothetical protein